ncbi:unnamed protein product, partial [Ectocarpus fasciculatus]
MKRAQFLKAALATSGLTITNPLSFFEIFISDKDVILPFMDGNRSVTLLRPKISPVGLVKAQVNGYYGSYSYGYLAPYQQWYAYQQAVAEWSRRMQYWQQQQYYTWLQQAHAQRMQAVLNHYSNYQNIGEPQVWPQVRSIYAFAKDNFNYPTLFGINKSRREVAVKDNVQGAAKIFNAVNQYYGESEAEKTVGPQSSESNAAIRLPNNDIKLGRQYDTANGIVAVSHPNEIVRDNTTGQVGRLAKFGTGPDGEQY